MSSPLADALARDPALARLVDARTLAALKRSAGGYVCARCLNPAAFRCRRCRGACYCSDACQTADWPDHRDWCPDPGVLVEEALGEEEQQQLDDAAVGAPRGRRNRRRLRTRAEARQATLLLIENASKTLQDATATYRGPAEVVDAVRRLPEAGSLLGSSAVATFNAWGLVLVVLEEYQKLAKGKADAVEPLKVLGQLSAAVRAIQRTVDIGSRDAREYATLYYACIKEALRVIF